MSSSFVKQGVFWCSIVLSPWQPNNSLQVIKKQLRLLTNNFSTDFQQFITRCEETTTLLTILQISPHPPPNIEFFNPRPLGQILILFGSFEIVFIVFPLFKNQICISPQKYSLHCLGLACLTIPCL